MTTKSWFTLRLVPVLLAVLLTSACSALLDTDKLTSTPKGDGPKDRSVLDIRHTEKPLPVDMGKCSMGANCTVGTAKGECAKGKQRCFEGTTQGVCDQTVQPKAETCNGLDDSCDGKVDECPQSMTCRKNATTTTCACGATGPTCKAGFTCDAAANACKCGNAKITCGPNDTCESNACKCGSTTSTTGPACGAQACTSNACVPKPDIGPVHDKPPVTPDKPPVTPDKPPVDLPVTPDKPPVDLPAVTPDKPPVDLPPVDLPPPVQ